MNILCLSLSEDLQCLSLSDDLQCPAAAEGCLESDDLQCLSLSDDLQCLSLSEDLQCLSLSDDLQCLSLSEALQCLSLSKDIHCTVAGAAKTGTLGRPGVQSHAPLSRYSPSADHSRTTSHLQHNSPAGNSLSSYGLQAGPGPALATDVRHHRLPTHSGSVAMDVHRHSLQTDPGPAVAADVHGSHGPWRGATQVTVATQEPAAAGRAHKETDGATGSRQADTGQTPHSAGNFISIYIFIC